jgi:hypothetical protein
MANSRTTTSKKLKSKASTRKTTRTKTTQKSGTSQLLNDSLALASTLLNSQKELGMEKFNFLVERTRDYASSLKAMPIIRDQVDYVADSLSQFSDYIVGTDFDQIALDAKKFAERNPVLTIGLTTIVGLGAIGLMTSTMSMSKGKRRKRPHGASKNGSKFATGARSRSNGHARLHS